MKRHRGFTLIELLIVMAIIALLAAIAVPSYLNQTRKSRRSELEGAVQQIALAEDRYRADCSSYDDFGATCAGATAITMPALTTFYNATYYTLKITNTGPTGYKVTAAAQAGQAKDSASGSSCATLTYDYGVTTPGTITQLPTACWAK